MLPNPIHHKITILVNDMEQFTLFMDKATIELNDTTEDIYALIHRTIKDLMDEECIDQLLNDQQALYLTFEKNFYKTINTENPDEQNLLGDLIWWANITDPMFKDDNLFFGRGIKDGLWLLTTKLRSEWLPCYLEII